LISLLVLKLYLLITLISFFSSIGTLTIYFTSQWYICVQCLIYNILIYCISTRGICNLCLISRIKSRFNLA
jgi:hypothetical protein